MSELVKNPFLAIEDNADPTIPTASLQIYQHIAETLDRPKETHINRASSASQCFKRRWYQRRGETGTPLAPRKLVNFLLGDLSERVLVHWVKTALVGPGKLYSEVDFGEAIGEIHFQGKPLTIYKQKDLSFIAAGIPCTAHADGFGKRNSDGQWEAIEFKSASNWGFAAFRNAAENDYLPQAHCLMQTDLGKARGVRQVRFFFLRKETGHIWDRLYDFDPVVWERVEAEFAAANADEEPIAPFRPIQEMTGRAPNKKPTGRRILTFPCSYCSYSLKCQGPYNVEWKEDGFKSGTVRPVYVMVDNAN